MNNQPGYPIHWFSCADGRIVPASETDQAHNSAEKYKRIRTYTEIDAEGKEIWHLCVSFGLWWITEYTHQDFRDAAAEAAKECAAIMAKQGKGRVVVTRTQQQAPIMTEEAFARYISAHPQFTSRGARALELVAVHGYSLTAAARVTGMNKPERNGQRAMARRVKALKKWIAEGDPSSVWGTPHQGGAKAALTEFEGRR